MSATLIKLKKRVLKTAAYKKQNKVVKKITSARNNIVAIDRALNICKIKGYRQWEIDSDAYWINKLIIKELI